MKKTLINSIYVSIILIIIIPILSLFIWTFTARWEWPYLLPSTYSLGAFYEIFRNKEIILNLFLSSIGISIIVAFFSVVIAYFSAKSFVFYDFFAKKLVYFCSILPFLVPASVFAMGIQVFFIKIGLAKTILGVVIVHIVYSLPYTTRLMIDAMKIIGGKYKETAINLGANKLQTIFLVELPLLFPVILSSFSLSYLISFSQYFLTLLIGGGKIKTFTIVMVPFLNAGNRNIASAYSLLFLAVTLVVFLIIDSISKKVMKLWA